MSCCAHIHFQQAMAQPANSSWTDSLVGVIEARYTTAASDGNDDQPPTVSDGDLSGRSTLDEENRQGPHGDLSRRSTPDEANQQGPHGDHSRRSTPDEANQQGPHGIPTVEGDPIPVYSEGNPEVDNDSHPPLEPIPDEEDVAVFTSLSNAAAEPDADTAVVIEVFDNTSDTIATDAATNNNNNNTRASTLQRRCDA